jgi:predicted HTH transcriptional regulator
VVTSKKCRQEIVVCDMGDTREINQKLTKRQQQIIDCLQIEPLTRQELMAKMDENLTDRVMQLELAKLKNMGLIRSEGKANTTLWFVITL